MANELDSLQTLVNVLQQILSRLAYLKCHNVELCQSYYLYYIGQFIELVNVLGVSLCMTLVFLHSQNHKSLNIYNNNLLLQHYIQSCKLL